MDQQFLNVNHLIGSEVNANPYHISVTRAQLVRGLAPYYPDMRDEIFAAFDELPDLKDNGTLNEPSEKVSWQTKPYVRSSVKLPTESSSAYHFVSRSPIPITYKLQSGIPTDRIILTMFPKFLVPFVSKILPNTPTNVRRATKFHDSTVKERSRCMREHGGEWSDKPNDILQWLIDGKQDFTTRQLSPRILLTNLVGILSPTSVGSVHHPLTIMSLFQIDFTQALYHLAAYP
ncbi:hypothetical protein F5141DRAFT_1212049 [Pisolithus sp. B1]|nr:hypothetical protein F5141DRAFT_1212049 [Pisolithus sp. B1]